MLADEARDALGRQARCQGGHVSARRGPPWRSASQESKQGVVEFLPVGGVDAVRVVRDDGEFAYRGWLRGSVYRSPGTLLTPANNPAIASSSNAPSGRSGSIVEELRTPTVGKIDKKALHADIAQRLAAV